MRATSCVKGLAGTELLCCLHGREAFRSRILNWASARNVHPSSRLVAKPGWTSLWYKRFAVLLDFQFIWSTHVFHSFLLMSDPPNLNIDAMPVTPPQTHVSQQGPRETLRGHGQKNRWPNRTRVLVLSYCLCVRQEGFIGRPAFEIACREHICKHEQGFFLPIFFRALHLQPFSSSQLHQLMYFIPWSAISSTDQWKCLQNTHASVATPWGGVCMADAAELAVYFSGHRETSLSPPVRWRATSDQLLKPIYVATGQGGKCMEDAADLAVYNGGNRETSLSPRVLLI